MRIDGLTLIVTAVIYNLLIMVTMNNQLKTY
jgi:hypothetical protein